MSSTATAAPFPSPTASAAASAAGVESVPSLDRSRKMHGKRGSSTNSSKILTPVVVCGSPYVAPQKDSQLLSPLLTAAAATAAAHNCGTGNKLLPQNNVPASESEKLTAMNPFVLSELKAPRPRPADIESTVCPPAVEPFRKAWWAGVRPTTCERTCRHRSKVCDAIQLCNDCTGYYCKWLAELVGIPVLKASGRADPIVFHTDPLAKLYWERISKVACCPKITNKCLMCIRRYQLFTHFLPGNLVFRTLVHESVMKLHEEGFAVDMGLIRKVTRRHLERIADSMELQLPKEYLPSLHAYDIIVQRGPLVDVLTNGLSSALVALGPQQSSPKNSCTNSNKQIQPFSSICGSPQSSGESKCNSIAQQDGAGRPQAGLRSSLHDLMIATSPSKVQQKEEGKQATDAVHLKVIRNHALSPDASENVGTTADLIHQLSTADTTSRSSATSNSPIASPSHKHEEEPQGKTDGETDFQVNEVAVSKNVNGSEDGLESGIAKRRSKRLSRRPDYEGNGAMYYESINGADPDFLAMLDEDGGVEIPSEDSFDEAGRDERPKRKRRRSVKRKLHEVGLGRSGSKELAFQGYGFEHQLNSGPKESWSFDGLAKQFRAVNTAEVSVDMETFQMLCRSKDLRESSQSTVDESRGPTSALRGSCDPRHEVRANVSVRNGKNDISALSYEQRESQALARLASSYRHQLYPKTAVASTERDEVVTSFTEAAHRQQLLEELRLAASGIRGVFWDPAESGWCVLLPLVPSQESLPLPCLKRKIICFFVNDWKSFDFAKWSAVYERLKRNPSELKFVDNKVRRDLSYWVRLNIEKPALSDDDKNDLSSLQADETSHKNKVSVSDNVPALVEEASASRLADILGSIVQHITSLGEKLTEEDIDNAVGTNFNTEDALKEELS